MAEELMSRKCQCKVVYSDSAATMMVIPYFSLETLAKEFSDHPFHGVQLGYLLQAAHALLSLITGPLNRYGEAVINYCQQRLQKVTGM